MRRQQPSLAPGNDATSDLCNRYLVGDLVQIIGGINCYGASGVITELMERRAQVELSAPGKDVVLISQCFLEKQAFIEPTIYNNKASAPNDVSRLNSTEFTGFRVSWTLTVKCVNMHTSWFSSWSKMTFAMLMSSLLHFHHFFETNFYMATIVVSVRDSMIASKPETRLVLWWLLLMAHLSNRNPEHHLMQ